MPSYFFLLFKYAVELCTQLPISTFKKGHYSCPATFKVPYQIFRRCKRVNLKLCLCWGRGWGYGACCVAVVRMATVSLRAGWWCCAARAVPWHACYSSVYLKAGTAFKLIFPNFHHACYSRMCKLHPDVCVDLLQVSEEGWLLFKVIGKWRAE